MCGGTWPERRIAARNQGLSPRVRGNHCKLYLAKHCKRSIPACAGEPLHLQRELVTARVYPRVCGGTHPGQSIQASHGGLSPRVRGNLVPESRGVAP